jgi:adenosylmethionine-8-amino-7-oxononanoate aminotransferase
VTSRRILDVLAAGSGAPLHNQTFSQFPVSCAAGLATLRILKAERLIERCARLGQLLHRRLAPLRDHPLVGDVRGRGLFAGIELVADRGSRQPFERSLLVAETLTAEAQDLGLVVWPGTGQADGTRGDLVLVGPPFLIDEDEIAELARRLVAALDRTAQRLGEGTSQRR